MAAARVELLRFYVGQRNANRRQLVATDAARQYFFLTGTRIEHPALRAFDERDRERPRLVTDDEFLVRGVAIFEMPAFGHRRYEHVAIAPRRDRVR